MALIDHFAEDAGTGPGENGFVRFATHLFTAGANLLAKGTITKQQFMDAFNMTQNPAPDADELQLDLIIAVYNGKNNVGQRSQYLHDIESALIAFEEGKVTKALVATHLEI